MKKEKLYLFKINDKVVQEMRTDEVDLEVSELEKFKSAVAHVYQTNYNDIDVEVQDVYVPEISEKMFVRADGSLMCNPHSFKYPTIGSNPHYVRGFQPMYDINHPELMEEFLQLISKGDIDNAITFY